MPAQGHDARVISHCFPRILLRAISHRCSDDQIIKSAPFGERNLERTEQCAEKCHASPAGEFADFVSQSRRNCGQPSRRAAPA